MKLETHPFKDFVPNNIKYLLLGSFTAKDSKKGTKYEWYYSNGRNLFWKLIEEVYKTTLPDKKSKMALFEKLGIGITDIMYKAVRVNFTSLDKDLKVVEFNPNIPNILSNNLTAVFFSSRFVENLFLKTFAEEIEKYPDTKFLYLPSPSPRYAAMSRQEKIAIYKQLLPKA